MVKKVAEKKKVEVNLKPVEIAEMQVNLTGLTPLLMEKMSDKTREQLLNIVTGKGKEKQKNRDLDEEVKAKIHKDVKGNVGFPAGGFKKAMVEVAPYLDGMDKKRAKGSFFVIGNLSGDLVAIKYKKQITNKAMGRDSGINRAPREIWRPEFQDWSCSLNIRYNAGQITPNQIVELGKLAGFHIGVGSWTPQHSGNYGTFTIAK